MWGTKRNWKEYMVYNPVVQDGRTLSAMVMLNVHILDFPNRATTAHPLAAHVPAFELPVCEKGVKC